MVVGLFVTSAFVLHRIAVNRINGQYVAKNFGVHFDRGVDANLAAQYSLNVNFPDAVDPMISCGGLRTGFTGQVSIHYISDSRAKIDTLQSIKPQSTEENNKVSVEACPTDLGPSYSKSINFDKKWIETGNTNKTIIINDQTYSLMIDKSNYVMRFQGPNNNEVLAYLPDGLGQLFAYPMYKNCMTIAQLKQYANDHSIVPADSKYPGLTAHILATPRLHLEGPDGSNNVLLVLTNDYVKQLITTTSQEKTSDICHVVASPPLVTEST